MLELGILIAVVLIGLIAAFSGRSSSAKRYERKRDQAVSRDDVVRGVRTYAVQSSVEPLPQASGRASPPMSHGLIGYHGLWRWWQSEFSAAERDYIADRYKPLGFVERRMDQGAVQHTTQSAVSFLQSLAGWFEKKHDRAIAYRILNRAEAIASEDVAVLDRHFLFGTMIKLYYKDRSEPAMMEKAIAACRRQIELAPEAVTAFKASKRFQRLPSHPGYEQLSIILHKKGEWQAVIDLCRQASDQGWAGRCDDRVARAQRKLAQGLPAR
jgi:hypothetical protein